MLNPFATEYSRSHCATITGYFNIKMNKTQIANRHLKNSQNHQAKENRNHNEVLVQLCYNDYHQKF